MVFIVMFNFLQALESDWPPGQIPSLTSWCINEALVDSNIPEVLQVCVKVFILQQLTSDEVVTQVELRHGQYLSFVWRDVAGGVNQVIPGDGLAAQREEK